MDTWAVPFLFLTFHSRITIGRACSVLPPCLGEIIRCLWLHGFGSAGILITVAVHVTSAGYKCVIEDMYKCMRL